MRAKRAMREATSPYLQVLIIIIITVSCSRSGLAKTTESAADLLDHIHPCNHDEVATYNYVYV